MDVSRFMHPIAKLTIACSLSLLLTNTASANMFYNACQHMATYTLDCGHWYVGGNLGLSHLHDKSSPGLATSVDENGPGWSVDGGYQFNSMLGLELGYTQYHDSRETMGNFLGVPFTFAQTEHYAVDLAATGRYPIYDRFSALGKLGIAYSYANKIFNLGPSFSSGSGSIYGGVGIDYSLTHTIDFILQWAAARGNNYTGSTELYSLGVQVALV